MGYYSSKSQKTDDHYYDINRSDYPADYTGNYIGRTRTHNINQYWSDKKNCLEICKILRIAEQHKYSYNDIDALQNKPIIIIWQLACIIRALSQSKHSFSLFYNYILLQIQTYCNYYLAYFFKDYNNILNYFLF